MKLLRSRKNYDIKSAVNIVNFFYIYGEKIFNVYLCAGNIEMGVGARAERGNQVC